MPAHPVLPGLVTAPTLGPWLPVRAAAPALAALADPKLPVVCLFGPAGAGKSHLLQQAAAWGVRVWDDLEVLPQDRHEPLFHALQHAVQGQGRVAVASIAPVAALPNLLPDVKSRLLTGPQLEVGLPDDQELAALLTHWASLRQLHLPPAVATYVLSRADRNPKELQGLLTQLDRLSLEEKRAISVPLARRVLEALQDAI